MSAAATPTIKTGVKAQRVPRFGVAVPLDVTVLRSGVPDCIPGRTVNASEGGLAAILAAELRPGESVGVEMRLPGLGLPLRTKATVRHCSHMRCGLEFLGLSADELAMLRHWMRQGVSGAPVVPADESSSGIPSPSKQEKAHRRAWLKMSSAKVRRGMWAALALFAVVGAVGWWQWYRAWQELESRLPGRQVATREPATRVPPSEMEQRVVHRVDPVYPETARQAKVQGVVLLDTVVGADGNVKAVRPVSGPSTLATAAAEALQWWRFQPYRRDGRPVDVETTVAIEFRQ